MPKTSKPEEDVINVAAPPGFNAEAIPIHEVRVSDKKVATFLSLTRTS